MSELTVKQIGHEGKKILFRSKMMMMCQFSVYTEVLKAV